jgi:ribonucleoside-diphosphate reductase alpha chain
MSEVASGNEMLAESKFYMGYSRWDEVKNGYETWEESVARVMDMHRQKYADKMTPELAEAMNYAQAAYSEKLVLGAQRALQFGGEQIFKHESRMYNCSVSYVDRPAFFNECMYLMLSGCGVGFSVGKKYIDKLPAIARRSQKKVKLFQVPDSIEGWADAFAVLLSSYFTDGATHPEYRGCQVHFDFTKIRPEGAKISGGFKAPGPDGLRKALIKCEDLIETLLTDKPVNTFNSITAYDFVMHMSDAVLSGGVRRSATICIFDKDDKDMLTAKTGDWFVSNPQRGRSNNSALIIRDELTRDEWAAIMKSVKEFGEPGFIFSDSDEFLFNPCVEIGMRPQTEDGRSGFQFCNLTEINGRKCINKEILMRACRASAILGTIQAGYTNFKYVSKETKEITDREALIGCSITGWMNNPKILFDKQNMIDGATLIMEVNAEIAALIGINPAARGTCVKPSGNASTLLTSASGIHGEHSEELFRHVQMNINDEVAKHIMEINPKMVEKSVWSSNGTDVVVAFPIETKPGSMYKADLMGVKQLEYVKLAQQYWVEYGTREERCTDKRLRHNVSNTITVDNWDEVEQYLFDNRQYFAGVSLMAASGDKAYAQAPFTEVLNFKKIVKIHGEGSLFASGLIVEALRAYNENLWLACDTFIGRGLKLSDESEDLLKRDWIRRAAKFANNFFDGDMDKMTACLKDCYNLHKWSNIKRTMKHINFSEELRAQQYVDVTGMGAQGCSGNACEINFN